VPIELVDAADAGNVNELAAAVNADPGLADGENGAATAGLLERIPAVRSPARHPELHGFDLQQPMKGGDVPAQVYQLLPCSHS
jgi:hypothetical protein